MTYDLCVWPDGRFCFLEDLEEHLHMGSDDYTIVAVPDHIDDPSEFVHNHVNGKINVHICSDGSWTTDEDLQEVIDNYLGEFKYDTITIPADSTNDAIVGIVITYVNSGRVIK